MQNIVKIIKISRPLYQLVGVIALLIITTAFLELLSPLLSKLIIDEIVAKVQNQGGDFGRLTFLIGLTFAAGLVSLILTVVTERLGDLFAGRLRKYLTEKYYDKVLSLPQGYFDSELSGKIVNQLARGIMTIQGFINASTNFIIPMMLQSIFTIAVLAYYNIPIAFFTFILFPIYLTISYYSSKKWGEYEVKKNAIEDVTRGRIQEVIGTISLVKSFIMEVAEFQFLSKKLDESNKIYDKQSTAFHIFDFFRGLSLIIVLLIINVIVFYNTFTGAITIGTMVLIIQLITQARRPLFAMSFILTQLQNAESGSKEFFEILSLPSKEDYHEDVSFEKLNDARVTFKNVSFHYESANQVLKNVSFEIEKGQKIALVGHSGAGKTTIVNLILKFYEPNKGEIYLNGKPYSELQQKLIRNNISLVFQENELFSSTIRYNVAYGKKGATDDDVWRALKLANAYDFVKKLPKQLGSEIGERGVKLSGGQKQRIQIARVILKDSPILILDEATSSLDAKSEREVQQALENVMKNKLVLIIAHRFSTIQNVHRILVLDEGKIVDSGAPRELAERPGIYRDLLNYQIEGNKKLLEKFEIY